MHLKPITAMVVLLLVVASLLVSGCTSSTSPTATPTVKATVAATAIIKATAIPTATATPIDTASFDPLLAKMATALKAEYGSSAVSQRSKNSKLNKGNDDAVLVAFESNGRTTTVSIVNEGSIDAASRMFKSHSTCLSHSILDIGSNTHFGQQAATVALGHAPTTVNDVYCKGTDTFSGADNEYLQYDQLYISTLVTTNF